MRQLILLISVFILVNITMIAKVTPQQFGARGDGIRDDTEAIQMALNCGGNVFIPAGVYKISGKLAIKSDTALSGESGSCIKQTKDAFFLYNEHSQVPEAEYDCNITIKDLIFDGSAVEARSEYTAGIRMCGVKNLVVENCILNDIGGDGIYLGRGGTDRNCKCVKIKNCVFNNCGRNIANPRQSIAIVFAEDVCITTCTMSSRRKSSYGVDVEPNKPDEYCSVSVMNCRMIGCGISCGGNKSAEKSIVIRKCHIDCSDTENATLSVVRSAAKIIGNTIISNGKQNGINVVTSPSAIVKKNIIRDASAGIHITDGADNVIIGGNTIENCSNGVYVMKSRGLAIISNILRVKGKGVYIRKESNGARVERNSIGVETGVTVYSAETEDVRVRNNRIL